MKKTNYHTHHYRCNHAVGEIKDYIEVAISRKMDEIGISCHVPYSDGRISGDRMEYKFLEDYFREIDKVKENFDINILKGLECEFFPELKGYYQWLKERTDFLILGQHFTYRDNGELLDSYYLYEEKDLELYKDWLVAGINTGIYDLVAHPDLFMVGYKEWDSHTERISREILEACQKQNMPIEYNANGVRYNRAYPRAEFWQLVKDEYPDLEIIVNSDAHDPTFLEDEAVLKARAYLLDNDFNLKDTLF